MRAQEISGEGTRVTREAMQDKEQRMASLGARFITDGMNRNEAVETSRMRSRSETALLFSAVAMVEAGTQKLLQWAADWVQPGSTVTMRSNLVVDANHAKTIFPYSLSAKIMDGWNNHNHPSNSNWYEECESARFA